MKRFPQLFALLLLIGTSSVFAGKKYNPDDFDLYDGTLTWNGTRSEVVYFGERYDGRQAFYQFKVSSSKRTGDWYCEAKLLIAGQQYVMVLPVVSDEGMAKRVCNSYANYIDSQI